MDSSTEELARTEGGLCSDRIVCHCLQVSEGVILLALKTHDLRSVKEIGRQTGAGDGCTACHRRLRRYLEEHGGRR